MGKEKKKTPIESPKKEETVVEKEELKVPDSIIPVPEEADHQEMKELSPKEQEKIKKIKLKYRTKENDIRYLGPLSYRYLRMLAWLCFAIAQIGIIFNIYSKIDPNASGNVQFVSDLSSFFSSLPLALFMLANFGVILRNRKNYKYLFIFYGGVMLAMYIVANIVVIHYVYGLAHTIDPDVNFQDVSELVGTFLASIGTTGYLFNLFVDLFLCVLTTFFLFYTPKAKAFSGKKLIIFRFFVIIPIVYEIASILIKHFGLLGYINIPTYFFFLLTSKPPLTFLAFFLVTLIMKIREYKFLKKFGNNYELLENHNSTHAHSLRTSITIAIVFSIISSVDLLAYFGYILIQFVKLGETEDAIMQGMALAERIGLGGSMTLILIAPLALLYSYTRVHKNTKIDSFVPFLGIALIIFTLFEGVYIVLRISIPDWIEIIESMLEGGGEEEFDPSMFEEAIRNSVSTFTSVLR